MRASCATCNSTLMITCWPAAVYLLSCSPALCCVTEFGQPEGWKAWGKKRRRRRSDKNWMKDRERRGCSVCVQAICWQGWELKGSGCGRHATLILSVFIILARKIWKSFTGTGVISTRRMCFTFEVKVRNWPGHTEASATHVTLVWVSVLVA